MRSEIGEGHFAAGYKRSAAGEKTDSYHYAAGKLNNSGGQHQGRLLLLSAQYSKQFLRAVTGEQRTRHNSHKRIEKV